MPDDDEVEINIFGPGYGESIVTHIGSGKWIIVDSCVDPKNGANIPLAYLNSIGVDVSASVLRVIFTHWHDDHIRGASDIVNSCKSADLCVPMAMATRDFVEFSHAYNSGHNTVVTSGTSEICLVFQIAKNEKRRVQMVGPKRELLNQPILDGSATCVVTSLSPSDEQIRKTLLKIPGLIPKYLTSKKRAPAPDRNDTSIVVWVEVGDLALLFGADLEEHGRTGLGWEDVLHQHGKKTKKAIFFKIPHHGSANGHHDGVWAEMVHADATITLTPWNLGVGLPKKTDIDRLMGLRADSYTTSRIVPRLQTRLAPLVERSVRESGIKLVAPDYSPGHVRHRIKIRGTHEVATELFGPACSMKAF